MSAYVNDDVKMPWYIDLLNLNLNNHDLGLAKQRIDRFVAAFRDDGTRITDNLDFEQATAAKARRASSV